MSNDFEKNVQSKRNDLIDAGVSVIVVTGFFLTIFFIAQLIGYIGTM